MRSAKILLVAFTIAIAFSMVANAAMKVGTFGIPNASGSAPLEVDSDKALTVASDATLSIAGEMTVTNDVVFDGSIYTPTATFEGAVYLPTAAVDPCPTLGPRAVFLNETTGAPCFCNTLSVDLSLYDGTSACF